MVVDERMCGDKRTSGSGERMTCVSDGMRTQSALTRGEEGVSGSGAGAAGMSWQLKAAGRFMGDVSMATAPFSVCQTCTTIFVNETMMRPCQIQNNHLTSTCVSYDDTKRDIGQSVRSPRGVCVCVQFPINVINRCRGRSWRASGPRVTNLIITRLSWQLPCWLTAGVVCRLSECQPATRPRSTLMLFLLDILFRNSGPGPRSWKKDNRNQTGEKDLTGN